VGLASEDGRADIGGGNRAVGGPLEGGFGAVLVLLAGLEIFGISHSILVCMFYYSYLDGGIGEEAGTVFEAGGALTALSATRERQHQ